jgi:class 3 adenylate cyclase
MCEPGLRSKVAGMNHYGLNYLVATQQIADRLAEADLRRRAGGHRLRAAGLRGRMRAHPVPTFVFADLVGYPALTEELGDGLAKEALSPRKEVRARTTSRAPKEAGHEPHHRPKA